MNFVEFAEQYYFPSTKQNVRSNTYVGYVGTYEKYVKPFFRDMDMDEISVPYLEKFVNSIESAGSARKAYMTFRQIIRKAQDYNMYNGKDPTRCHIKIPKTQGNTGKILNKQEVVELVNGFKGHPLEACVICSVSMGLRRCESFGLKWSDIDANTGQVHIHRSRQVVQGQEVVYPPKTKLSDRICYLPEAMLVRLNELRMDEDDWILPIPVKDAAMQYKRHCQRNNLPYTPFMNLRHTWATIQVESGTDILFVANMLGHVDLTMASTRYVKPSEKCYMQAQCNLNTMFEKPKEKWYPRIKNKVVQVFKRINNNRYEQRVVSSFAE